MASAELVAELDEKCARSLWIGSNALGAAGGRAVGTALAAAKTKVTRLSVASGELGGAGLAALRSAMGDEAEEALYSLALSLNSLGGAEAAGLAQSLEAGGTLFKLRSLALGGNPILPQGAMALAEALSTGQPALTELHLGHCNIGDSGGIAIARVIAKGENKTLRSLHLHSNLLRGGAATEIARAVEANTLDELRLSDNPLGSSAAALICTELPKAFKLRRLWIERVGLDVASVPALAETIADGGRAMPIDSGAKLELLSLVGNCLSDDDASAIGEALRGSRSLRKLWLSDNRFGRQGALGVLVGALSEECRLLQLWLGGPAITAPTHAELETIVSEGNILRSRLPSYELTLRLTKHAALLV